MSRWSTLTRWWAALRARPIAVVGPAPVGSADADTVPAPGGPSRDVRADAAGGPYSCPCCGHRTLPERGSFEWCRECDWEDDGQDEHDLDVVRGGPNGSLSLRQARAEYVRRGGDRHPHDPPPFPPR